MAVGDCDGNVDVDDDDEDVGDRQYTWHCVDFVDISNNKKDKTMFKINRYTISDLSYRTQFRLKIWNKLNVSQNIRTRGNAENL